VVIALIKNAKKRELVHRNEIPEFATQVNLVGEPCGVVSQVDALNDRGGLAMRDKQHEQR
jgi:hypothetical protein